MTTGWLTRLAEADAGLPDEAGAARTIAAAGPRSERVLAALAATRADLAGIPPARMPASVAARLAAGFDHADAVNNRGRRTEHAAQVDIIDLRIKRRKRRPLVLTAAAAALVALVLLGPPAAPAPPTDLATATADVLAEGTREAGPLTDPRALAACLHRAGAAPPAGPLLAGRPVVVHARAGTLLVLGTGTLGRVRAVVPALGCEALLGDLTVGG